MNLCTALFLAWVGFSTGHDAFIRRCFGCAREAAESRLYGGIHCRSANDDGLAVGVAIGDWTFTHVMKPKGNRSRE